MRAMRRLMIPMLSLFVLVSACKKEEEPVLEEETTEVTESQARQVIVIEPLTSVNCGACPLSHHRVEEIEEEFEDVTHISHYLFGPLHHPYTDYLIEKINKTAYTPLGHINRRHEQGSVVYYPVNMYRALVIDEQNEGTPVELDLSWEITDGTLNLDLA